MRFSLFLGLISLVPSWAIALDEPNNPTALSCKTLPSDPSWPAPQVWVAAMPTVMQQKETKTGKHPDYRLVASSVEDVIAGVQFAKKHNVRLTIITTGHDFLGRNDAPTGLVIVLSNLKGIRISSTYTPTAQGVEPVKNGMKASAMRLNTKQAYVTFGAGYSTQLLNNELAPSSLFTMGAAHGEVAVAGGWAHAGGHGPFTSQYGLGADQPVEFKVVTADGQMKVANAVSNPDLFWALKGGGGGTFGVVVETTIKAYASPRIAVSNFYLNTTNFKDHKSIWAPTAYMHTQLTKFMDNGMSGYYFVWPNAITVSVIKSGTEGTKAWLDANWKPVTQKMTSHPGISSSVYYNSVQYANFKSFYDAFFGEIDKNKKGGSLKHDKRFPDLQPRHGPGVMQAQPMGIFQLDSWLLSSEQMHSPKLSKVLEETMPWELPSACLRGQAIGGGNFFKMGNDTSVLPAWRKTYVHLVQSGYGQSNAAPLRKFAPEMGAYINEASRFTPDWKHAFWGDNYDRLAQIKRKYDPSTLFWVTPGVGADLLSLKDGRLCQKSGAVRLPDRGEVAPTSENPIIMDAARGDESSGPPFPFIMGPGGRSMLNPAALGVGPRPQ